MFTDLQVFRGVDPLSVLVLKHGFCSYFQVQINKDKDYKHAYAF